MRAYGVEEKYRIVNSNTQDKWFGSTYVRGGMNDTTLKVGGWGDKYYSLIKMPVDLNIPGAPRVVLNRITLNLHSINSLNRTSMRKWFVRSSWSEASTMDHWSMTIASIGLAPLPPVNGLYSFDISSEFYYWISQTEPNYGILLEPENTDNTSNYFASSENKPEWRPYIEVSYEKVPEFRLPLPGNKRWKLTVEVGGKDYNTQAAVGDPFHTGNTHYSLDFSSHWIPLAGGTEQTATDVPIYAAAGGKIVGLANNVRNPNGWFVKIDHDYDGNVNTGFQTVYIHLKNQPNLSIGDVVQKGGQIGIMGTTGEDANGNPTSTGVHLHMTFYFKNKAGTGPDGPSSSEELNFVRMGGILLKNYKLSTTWRTDLNPDQWNPTYYGSSSPP
ncbi:MAG: hypothetical protein AB197_00155 [Parcubacteria bacterium C7867-002]|nr:MAG: hypothetical protein AB197_00155 [Parcubacteria bacterium C7867-002]